MKVQHIIGVVFVAIVCGAPIEDCGDNAVIPPSQDISNAERVGPDYHSGPWFVMPDDHPFQAWTKRPRIEKIVKLLAQVAENVVEMEKDAKQARADKIPDETRMINEATETVKTLQAEIQTIQEREDAFQEVLPTQNAINDLVANRLAPELKRLSELQQTSSEIRYPFAERLAESSRDLQSILGAKIEASKKLKGVVPEAEYKETLAKMDELGKEVQKKIDEEIETATQVLNGNRRDIEDSTKTIETVEDQIKQLRTKLSEFISEGGERVPREESVKLITLNEQNDLIDALTRAGKVEDGIVTSITETREETVAKLRHVVSILGAMLDEETPEQSGSDQLRASQKIFRPVD